MFGFALTLQKDIQSVSAEYATIEYGNYVLTYNKLNKFEDDKLFFETERYIILLDGVVFNKKDFFVAYKSWSDSFENLCRQNKNYMDLLRGSFCGVTIDKETGVIEAYTNQSGEHAVYYTIKENAITIFSNIMFLKELRWNYPIEPDDEGCCELLSVGGVLHGSSPYKGIKRLGAGQRLRYVNGTTSIEHYHKFTNSPEVSLSFSECIDRADELFLNAVKRIFEKNAEYGYRNECDLSGGLDSRLAFFAARKLGYKNIVNVCYAMEGSYDHLISKKISEECNGEYVYIPMTSGMLKSVDTKTCMTGGQVDYILYSEAITACESIRDRNIGLTCMGLLGEISKAEYIKEGKHSQPEWCGNNRTSLIYQYPSNCKKEYNTYEELNLYERGFNIIVTSIIARQQYVEAYSPFIDPDFMDFILSIPASYRENCRFEIEWIKEKYPDAASFQWQRTGKKVNNSAPNNINALNSSTYSLVLRTINKAFRLTHIPFQLLSKYDMGPVEKWYYNDSSVKKFMDEYYTENISKIHSEKIMTSVKELWNSKEAMAHIEVVNLLSVFKNIINC